jgi:hypothetical protein
MKINIIICDDDAPPIEVNYQGHIIGDIILNSDVSPFRCPFTDRNNDRLY